jgi:acylphosphatase
MGSMPKRLECQIFGRVQLVMFRDFAKRNARARGLSGMVKNNPDGSVSLIAEGDEAKLRELLVLLGRGSLLARVDRVAEKWEAYLGEYQNFDIIYA